MIGLRPTTEADLALIATWLREPHVAQWWTPDTTQQSVMQEYRDRLSGHGDLATVMLTVTEDGNPIGWCQWYRWADYPEEALAMGALPGECGIDYAIGSPTAVGRRLGTQVVSALVAEVRRHHPGAGVLVDPEADNWPSRKVLEHNGFQLVAVRPVACEPRDDPMAVYRLPAQDHAA